MPIYWLTDTIVWDKALIAAPFDLALMRYYTLLSMLSAQDRAAN